jgi:hypothetical protein
MTPNDKSFKGRCGSYSAHATPRRRKGISITKSDDSIDETEDISLPDGITSKTFLEINYPNI